ncbi:MAG TPA: hypothetical protein VFQ92_20515 [Blastocatellia bacterium]|nr:hypothetical protein [Blastocatellia bacterium]
MKPIAFTLIVALTLLSINSSPAYAGLDSKKAMYVGGTVKMKEKATGKALTSDEKVFQFQSKYGNLDIPYDKVTSLEYGQKAGRRVAVAILVTPFALFSKKRKHYLTITFKDESDKEQAAVFELGKDIVRVTLANLQVRTGKEIEYQDEEAQKSAKGN